MPSEQIHKRWTGRSREPLNHRFEQWKGSLALFTILVVATTASGQTKESVTRPRSCSQSIIDRLESESDGIRSWSKLQAFYRRYRVCKVDDAEVSTGVSESVARMLADHWQSLAAAQTLFKHDASFEKFALAGLNITDLTDDLNRIGTLASKQCPAGLNELCQKIRNSIRDNH